MPFLETILINHRSHPKEQLSVKQEIPLATRVLLASTRVLILVLALRARSSHAYAQYLFFLPLIPLSPLKPFVVKVKPLGQ